MNSTYFILSCRQLCCSAEARVVTRRGWGGGGGAAAGGRAKQRRRSTGIGEEGRSAAASASRRRSPSPCFRTPSQTRTLPSATPVYGTRPHGSKATLSGPCISPRNRISASCSRSPASACGCISAASGKSIRCASKPGKSTTDRREARGGSAWGWVSVGETERGGVGRSGEGEAEG